MEYNYTLENKFVDKKLLQKIRENRYYKLGHLFYYKLEHIGITNNSSYFITNLGEA